MEKKYILDQETAARKIKRLAYEIVERNYNLKHLFFAGIQGPGTTVAKILAREVMSMSSIKVDLLEVAMDKKNPKTVTIDQSIGFSGKTILLIDDVANSGKTMLYAFLPFLQDQPQGIQTLVLVERTHKAFPVQVDYVGMSIATTLEEHIYVEIEEGVISGAYLV
ncbi:MAG: phosphoribosyltransferase family protein [Lacibacter sp.]